MAKMTKAQARRRLMEAEAKFKKVFLATRFSGMVGPSPVKLGDMEAISKIVKRCVDRIR